MDNKKEIIIMRFAAGLRDKTELDENENEIKVKKKKKRDRTNEELEFEKEQFKNYKIKLTQFYLGGKEELLSNLCHFPQTKISEKLLLHLLKLASKKEDLETISKISEHLQKGKYSFSLSVVSRDDSSDHLTLIVSRELSKLKMFLKTLDS